MWGEEQNIFCRIVSVATYFLGMVDYGSVLSSSDVLETSTLIGEGHASHPSSEKHIRFSELGDDYYDAISEGYANNESHPRPMSPMFNTSSRTSLSKMRCFLFFGTLLGGVAAALLFRSTIAITSIPSEGPLKAYELTEVSKNHLIPPLTGDFLNAFSFFVGSDTQGSLGYQQYVARSIAVGLGLVSIRYEDSILEGALAGQQVSGGPNIGRDVTPVTHPHTIPSKKSSDLTFTSALL